MPEGAHHVALVDLILSTLPRVATDEDLAIFTDRAGETVDCRSPRIGGFIPDVYAVGTRSLDLRVIGEAKSSKDFFSARTEPQLRAFLQHLSIYSRGVLLVAVPFSTLPSVNALMRRLLVDGCRNVEVIAMTWHASQTIRSAVIE